MISSIGRPPQVPLKQQLQRLLARAMACHQLSARNLRSRLRHLDRRHGGIETLVAVFAAGAVCGLFHGVGRQHAERHGHPGFRRRRRDSPGRFAGDIFEMRRVASDHRARDR